MIASMVGARRITRDNWSRPAALCTAGLTAEKFMESRPNDTG